MSDILFIIAKTLPLALIYSFVSNYFYFYILFKSQFGKKLFLRRRLYDHDPSQAEAVRSFQLALISETMFATVFIVLINSNTPFFKDFVQVRWSLVNETWWGLLFEALIIFTLNEIFHYAVHTTIHRRPLFKYFHHLHHTIRYPIPQSASVAQWTEQIIYVLPFVILLVCDVHIISILIFSTVIKFFSLIQHSGHEFLSEEVRSKFPIKYFNTATFHQIHHSTSVRHNFGFVTNILDRVFKTIYNRKS